MMKLPRPFAQSPLALASGGVIASWLIVAIAAPLVAPYGPLAQDMSSQLMPPNRAHWLGTDVLGRDVFSRIMYGARLSIPVGLVAVALAVSLGIGIGSLAGYFGGMVDESLMRLTDLMLAFPTVILAMVITAALGAGIKNAVIAIMVAWWPSYARVMRGQVLAARQREYVDAVRALGASSVRIFRCHIFPNTVSPLVIIGTIDLGVAILTFASLSFLGLGPPPETAEWGAMVASGRNYFNQWWIATFPGLAIVSVVVPFNLVGDVLRDWMDPKGRRN
jgi:peptide/nickel transport system permease protein